MHLKLGVYLEQNLYYLITISHLQSITPNSYFQIPILKNVLEFQSYMGKGTMS